MSQLLQGPPSREAGGQIDSSDNTDAPDYWHNGIPYDTGDLVAIDIGGAVASHHQGMPLTAAGRIAAVAAVAIDHFNSGAMPIAADGKLVTVATGVDHFQCGVGYASDGKVVI